MIIGTFATEHSGVQWPDENVAGMPVRRFPPTRYRGIGNNQFVVLDGVPADFDIDAAIAKLVKPAKRASAKDSGE